MKELTGNIWDYSLKGVICITTNGDVNKHGKCVMGRGLALQAAKRMPDLPTILGERISSEGNHVHEIEYGVLTLFSFPVKVHWNEKAKLWLIQRSCQELLMKQNGRNIYITRAGCSNGLLSWEHEVKSIFEQEFNGNDAIFVINNS